MRVSPARYVGGMDDAEAEALLARIDGLLELLSVVEATACELIASAHQTRRALMRVRASVGHSGGGVWAEAEVAALAARASALAGAALARRDETVLAWLAAREVEARASGPRAQLGRVWRWLMSARRR